MKYRCCRKFRHPKVFFRASIADLIGIIFLGGFFGGIFYLIGWGVFAALMSSVETGEFGDRTWYGVRQGAGYLVILVALIKGAPIFLKILSFFVNFKLKITSNCNSCGNEVIHIDLPTEEDPF